MEQAESVIVRCEHCGAKNRITPRKSEGRPRCGKCRRPLSPKPSGDEAPRAYTMRCSRCRVKNRIPSDKIDGEGRCGKCGAPLDAGELFLPQPFVLTDDNFDNKVVGSPLPVLVFSWAPWCPSCKSATPVVEAFASEILGRARVGKLNVDHNPALSSKFNIMSVPALLVFDNGQLKESFSGATDKSRIMRKMAPYL